MRKEASLRYEASLGVKRLAFFSDNRELLLRDILLNLSAIYTEEAFNEPRNLQKRRQEIKTACAVISDLSKAGIPAIVSAPIYQALKLKGL
jgi:hypothetical protein